jgi:hypothetical protein
MELIFTVASRPVFFLASSPSRWLGFWLMVGREPSAWLGID